MAHLHQFSLNVRRYLRFRNSSRERARRNRANYEQQHSDAVSSKFHSSYLLEGHFIEHSGELNNTTPTFSPDFYHSPQSFAPWEPHRNAAWPVRHRRKTRFERGFELYQTSEEMLVARRRQK